MKDLPTDITCASTPAEKPADDGRPAEKPAEKAKRPRRAAAKSRAQQPASIAEQPSTTERPLPALLRLLEHTSNLTSRVCSIGLVMIWSLL